MMALVLQVCNCVNRTQPPTKSAPRIPNRQHCRCSFIIMNFPRFPSLDLLKRLPKTNECRSGSGNFDDQNCRSTAKELAITSSHLYAAPCQWNSRLESQGV